jgi:hypothetical protein
VNPRASWRSDARTKTRLRIIIDTAILSQVHYLCSVVRLAPARFPLNPKSFFLETSMSAIRSVDRSAVTRAQDRASLCSFTFLDGRRCRMPRRHGHPYLCTFHACREAKIFARENVGEDIARYLSGEHVPAGDLCSALGRLFAAVAQGEVEPQTVAALAHLGRSLVQALHVAQEECAIASKLSSGKRVILRDTSQPTLISPRQASPNPHHRHPSRKHRVPFNSQKKPKIPSSPNHSESTLAKL